VTGAAGKVTRAAGKVTAGKVTAGQRKSRSRPARTAPAGYLGRVEEINRRIIALLSRDGRMSFTELARQTGLSVSAAQQRVRRLERLGVIRGYAALFDPVQAGLPLTAFVSIKPFDPAAPDDAPARLAHLPAIEACHSVAGEENYILKVRVASPAALEDMLQEIRAAANVSTRTTIVLSTPYENRPPDVRESGTDGEDAQ
jgi:Lrp/AsnC family transcriptional regulator, leucine-responsive regulatory protein